MAERLQSMSPTAIEPVMALLRDRNPQVRALAGYVLRGMPGLDGRHLPELERAVEAGDAWLPPAIASIGTPEAIHFLIEQLKEDPESDTQLTGALVRLGTSVLPDLVALFDCGGRCNQELLEVTGEILAGMKDAAAGAADPLVQVATNRGATLAARRAALDALARMGLVARPAAPALLAFWRKAPGELRDDALRAVIAVGGAGAKEAFGAALESPPRRGLALRDIGALGPAGREAGPAVERLLDAGDRNDRVVAARTLGFIGYAPAVPALGAALHDPDHWRLAFVAAESLGRLRAAGARTSLAATASGHWFPPVREAARTALEALEGRHRYPEPGRDSFASRFWSWERAERGPRGCDDPSLFPPAPVREEVLEPARQPALAESLAYDREIRSYSPEGERVTHRRTVPEVGLRIDGAWLVGTDRGEWGGELVLKPDGGRTQVVLPTNIAGLHVLPDGQIVAVTGLAHMGVHQGELHRVTCSRGESCRATWWKALPGAPKSSWVLESRELLVDTTAGTVLVSPEGTFRMAECPAQLGGRPPEGR